MLLSLVLECFCDGCLRLVLITVCFKEWAFSIVCPAVFVLPLIKVSYFHDMVYYSVPF